MKDGGHPKREDSNVAEHMDREEVNNVAHYEGDKCMRNMEAAGWGRDTCLSAAYKYLFRLGMKDPAKVAVDARKAVWYLERFKQQTPYVRLSSIEGSTFVQVFDRTNELIESAAKRANDPELVSKATQAVYQARAILQRLRAS